VGIGPRTAFTGAAGAGAGASENIQKFQLESKEFIEKSNISRIHKCFAVNENNNDDNHEA
jgi:hypothetical protein